MVSTTADENIGDEDASLSLFETPSCKGGDNFAMMPFSTCTHGQDDHSVGGSKANRPFRYASNALSVSTLLETVAKGITSLLGSMY
jgi:hypothetical protein